MAGQAIDVEFLSQSAEETLPLSDESVDTVVITWTLCSIANPAKALRQMKRVLKPSGRLIFVEHGGAPDSSELQLGRIGSLPFGSVAGVAVT